MTFDEWLENKVLSGVEREFARDAWSAATKECARKVTKLAEDFARRGLEGAVLITDCAKSMRSNAGIERR